MLAWVESESGFSKTLHLLGGIALPPFPSFTHNSLIATAVDQMLDQEVVSTCGSIKILVPTIILHWLSAKKEC